MAMVSTKCPNSITDTSKTSETRKRSSGVGGAKAARHVHVGQERAPKKRALPQLQPLRLLSGLLWGREAHRFLLGGGHGILQIPCHLCLRYSCPLLFVV